MAGVIRPSTARARKVAAEQLLVQLKSHERLDLRQLDVDDLCTRFHKLQGSTIRPETLQIYNERLKRFKFRFEHVTIQDGPEAAREFWLLILPTFPRQAPER